MNCNFDVEVLLIVALVKCGFWEIWVLLCGVYRGRGVIGSVGSVVRDLYNRIKPLFLFGGVYSIRVI